MSPVFRSFLGVLAVLTVTAGTAQAQASSRDRANTARGAASGQDENIRVATGSNTRGAAGEQAPSQKAEAGTATRGSSDCRVHFDNRSNLYVATYADGMYRGELSPWGDIYTYVIAGPTRLYARASFTDGSVSTWGPRMVDCLAGGSTRWQLYP